MFRRAVSGVEDAAWPYAVSTLYQRAVRYGRAIRRGILFLVWTILSGVVQGLLLALPGRGKVAFARLYWNGVCRLLGLRVRVIGQRASGAGARAAGDPARPVVYVSNHSSWLDIPVLGGQVHACFISKEDVSSWPLINVVARLGRTVYVRRLRASTGRERDDMRGRLAAGDNLVLFPEGTTSDGSRVLPFRSAFLSVAEPVTPEAMPPLVQPVSIVYDRLGYLPTGRSTRALFAWYGDMSIGPHFWRLAQHRGLRATVLLHAPIDPRAYPSRKALALAVWTAVADGAATLRQNRPPRPSAPAPDSAPLADAGRPVFA